MQMVTTAEPLRGGDVPLVVLVGQGVDWAIEAQRVLSAQFAAEWTGTPPIDMGAFWGAGSETPSDPARIVVVATQDGPRAFSSIRLSFRSVDRDKILPLPHVVARGPVGRLIRGVVFSDSEPAMLVLDPDAFVNEPKPTPSDSLPGTRE
jgi:hypothetical protein